MCNWDEVGCMHKVSLYVFAKEQDAINMKKTCWWVAQFFVHGEFPSTNGETTPHNFEV